MRWHRSEKPVDRLLRALDRELAQVRRQARLAERKHPSPSSVEPHARSGRVDEFVGEMLTAPKSVGEPTYRVHVPPLIDVAPNLARDWEAIDAESASTKRLTGAEGRRTAVERMEGPPDKLVKYLSVGSLRQYPNDVPSRENHKTVNWVMWSWVGLGIIGAVALFWLIR